MITHIPHEDLHHHPLAGSEYIGEWIVRVYLSVLLGAWEHKQPLAELLLPYVQHAVKANPHHSYRMLLINSFSVSEFDAQMVAEAYETFGKLVREAVNGHHDS